MKWTKLKAGALQLSLFIMVIVALLLASFVLLIHVQKRFTLQTGFVVESVSNSNNGINYALYHSIQLNDTTGVDLNNKDYSSIEIHRDYWGIFEKIVSTSKVKNKIISKIALVGGTRPESEKMALYLEDNNRPLVLVGQTKIEGLTYLPKRGVKTGNISGQSYYGSRLIYGQTKTATELPLLSNEINEQLNILKEQFTDSRNELLQIELQPGKTFSNSFSDPLKQVLSSSTIVLSNIQLVGHIVVQSKSKIIVEPTALLKDIILIAPEIEIRNYVEGTFQCFASRAISIGRNCKMNYPSALVLTEEDPVSSNPLTSTNQQSIGITINESSRIKGVVVYHGKPKSNNYKPQVSIDLNATVEGEVYCNQNLELKGSVFGTVFTSNFITNQFGSVYQNHIYNGTISIMELSQRYVGLSFFDTERKGVIKWLY